MATEPIDTVSVRLVGDATQLINDLDQGVRDTEAAGEKAGEGFRKAFLERAMAAGQEVKRLSEEIGSSLEEAASQVSIQGGVGAGFDKSELVSFAQALSDVGTQAAATTKKIASSDETLQKFGDRIGSDIIPRHAEFQKAVGSLNDAYKAFGTNLSEDVKKALDENVQAIQTNVTATKENIEALKQTASYVDQAATWQNLMETQINRVTEAYKAMNKETPDAVEREKLRRYMQSLIALSDSADQAKEEIIKYGDKQVEAAGATERSTTTMDKFGKVLGISGAGIEAFALSLVKGIGIMALFHKALAEIQKATAYALDFSETERKLAYAVALNTKQVGENVYTFQEWNDLAVKISTQFGGPLRKSMVDVTAAVQLLTQNTSLTDDQLAKLITDGTAFSKVMGKDTLSSIQQLTQFINSGYGESLRAMGVDVSKTAQNQKAFDMGLGHNVDSLTEAQKEMVRYNLLMDQMGKFVDIASSGQETFAGRLEKANLQAEKTTLTLGNMFAGIAVASKEFWARVGEGLVSYVGIMMVEIVKIGAFIISNLIALAANAIDVINQFKQGKIPNVFEQFDKYRANQAAAYTDLVAEGVKNMTGAMDQFAPIADKATEALDRYGNTAEEAQGKIDAFVKAAQDYDQGMAQIAQRFESTMQNIQTQFLQRNADLLVKYARDARDIDAKSAEQRLKAIRDNQVKEIRMREDFQLDIRRLEERYILDLQDAVRDRDARRVLDLQRQFNMEKQKRTEDYDLAQKRRKEDFQLELADLERQRQIRQQERYLEYQEQLADEALQAQRRREEAAAQRKIDEANLLADIKRRFDLLEEAAANELGISTEKLDALKAALDKTYGAGGYWDEYYSLAVEAGQNAATAVNNANKQLVDSLRQTDTAILAHLRFVQQARALEAGLNPSTASRQEVLSESRLFQRGGSFVATNPTQLIVGERRPERVSITPLSQATGAPSAGFRGQENQGKIQIALDVQTSEYLDVRIADRTMSDIADVIVSLNQGGGGMGGARRG
jgi:hypothetical protein